MVFKASLFLKTKTENFGWENMDRDWLISSLQKFLPWTNLLELERACRLFFLA